MQRRHSNNDVVAATAATYSSGIRRRPRCSTARMFADDSLPSRLSLLPSILVGQSTSAANSRGTNALISQAQRKHLRPSTSSEEISRAAQPISVSSVAKHLWDLSQNMHHQYGTTVSNTTLIKSSRFRGTLHVSPVVITDGHQVWQWDSFQQRRARSQQGPNAVPNQGRNLHLTIFLVSSLYLLQHTLNQFPSAPEGSKQGSVRHWQQWQVGTDQCGRSQQKSNRGVSLRKTLQWHRWNGIDMPPVAGDVEHERS